MPKELYRKFVKINNYTQGGILTARVMAECMSSMFESFNFKHPEYTDDFQIVIGEINTELTYTITDGSKEG